MHNFMNCYFLYKFEHYFSYYYGSRCSLEAVLHAVRRLSPVLSKLKRIVVFRSVVHIEMIKSETVSLLSTPASSVSATFCP